jgi:hypothetical protein
MLFFFLCTILRGFARTPNADLAGRMSASALLAIGSALTPGGGESSSLHHSKQSSYSCLVALCRSCPAPCNPGEKLRLLLNAVSSRPTFGCVTANIGGRLEIFKTWLVSIMTAQEVEGNSKQHASIVGAIPILDRPPGRSFPLITIQRIPREGRGGCLRMLCFRCCTIICLTAASSASSSDISGSPSSTALRLRAAKAASVSTLSCRELMDFNSSRALMMSISRFESRVLFSRACMHYRVRKSSFR